MTIIFSTVHGSHLYGMERAESDMDMFIVTDSKSRKATHRFDPERGVDVVSVGFDAFLTRVYEGSHQSVEALFSPFKLWNRESHLAEDYKPYLAGLRVTGTAVFAKYERTIARFCYGDFKRRRHAVRLALNLTDLRNEGRFNPVMSPQEVVMANDWAAEFEGDALREKLF